MSEPGPAHNEIQITETDVAADFANPVPGWIASCLFHVVLLLLIALVQIPASRERLTQIIRLIPDQTIDEQIVREIDFRKFEVGPETGGESELELESALMLADVPEIEAIDEPIPEVNVWSSQQATQLASGADFFKRYKTKGLVGVGTNSTNFAIDRLTREVLLLLEERPTLLVWLLDQSASVIPQREAIYNRLDRIYRELGAVQASGTFGKREKSPLLSSVVAFGRNASLRISKPTNDVERIKQAVAGIERDETGLENVFEAVTLAVEEFGKFRRLDRRTGQPLRNVAFVIFTDESGDDQQRLEMTISKCQQLEIPVYVVGVPAPFGQRETIVKWIDPDPSYDQSPGWGRVNQGPETAAVERIRLGNATDPKKEAPVDSGFGPYALTRLCYETGGIYFAVHPDRDQKRRTRLREVQPFTSHIRKFFDSDVMQRYRPDYVSLEDYRELVRENDARTALVRAAEQSWIAPMRMPRQSFILRDEAQFARELTEAQKVAAVLEPRLEQLLSILSMGEKAREQEEIPRWQAGYDLAMGRTIATLVRAKSFNSELAKAKRGLPFTKPNNNTWTIHAAETVNASSELERQHQRAERYLQRVVDDHPGTPWAYLAKQELAKPIGWKWRDSFTPTREEMQRERQNNPNRTPRDEQALRLQRRPKREIPRL